MMSQAAMPIWPGTHKRHVPSSHRHAFATRRMGGTLSTEPLTSAPLQFLPAPKARARCDADSRS